MYIITGAAGFIGSYLSRYLLEQKKLTPDQLLLVDLEMSFKNRKCTEWIRKNYTPVCISPEELENSISHGGLRGKVKGVFHMGASSSTEEMRLDFLKRWNLDYSKVVWNFCAQETIPLVYASSAATYGDGSLGFSDSPELFNKLKPLNPYGQSKLDFDIWAHNQSLESQSPSLWAGLRFFNVYGPGEEHKGSQATVVVHAHKQILQTGSLKLFKSHRAGIADGFQKRDFVFVEDVAKVCEFFMFQKPKQSGVFNVGTGKASTFLELGQECFKALGKKENISFIPTPEKLREHYQYFTEADLSHLKKAGYEASFKNLRDGISQTFLNYY